MCGPWVMLESKGIFLQKSLFTYVHGVCECVSKPVYLEETPVVGDFPFHPHGFSMYHYIT